MNDDEKGDDPELAAWRGEWQALGGREDLAAELVARAAKDGKKMRRAAAAEVLAATFSTSVCLWLVVRSRGALEIVAMTAFILLFNGAWLAHFFTVRAGLFGGGGRDVGAFIELTRRRLATQRRWTSIARRWTLAIVAVVVPWSVWVFVAHRDAYLAAPWRAVIGFGGVAVIVGGLFAWLGFKARKLRAEEEAFERHIADAQLPG